VTARSNPSARGGEKVYFGKYAERFRVVLVEPEKEGNIGSIARSMKNFDLTDLWIVSPKTPIGDEAYRYAKHGRDILMKARLVNGLAEALDGVDHVVGTTAIAGTSSRNVLRTTIDLAQLVSRLATTSRSVALLFGRESKGLNNRELQLCTMIASIPASEEYSVLNVATAASIVFYELHKVDHSTPRSPEPSQQSVEQLASTFVQLTRAADLPAHRRRLADRAFRNVLAKSMISKREVTLLMGVLRRIREKTSPVPRQLSK
jgi:tRNA/rRNA methyltransferase